ESGTYLIVVSEDGACGTSANAGTSNGFPAITCVGSSNVGEVVATGFNMFPNPTNGLFTIDLQGMRTGVRDMLEVIDLSGRRVMNEQIGQGEVIKQLDLTAQPAGTYFVNIHQADRVLREKLVLVKD